MIALDLELNRLCYPVSARRLQGNAKTNVKALQLKTKT